MKYTITAVIPTVQYGNLQPAIEVEADTFEEANAKAMPHIEKLWAEYADKPLVKKTTTDQTDKGFVKLTSFTGEQVLWNKERHICKTLDGVVLTGGSTYAKRFEKPFDALRMAQTCAKAWGLDKEDILDIWKMNGNSSSMLGDSLHNALEAAHKHWDAGEVMKAKKKWKPGEEPMNGALPKQPILRKAVLQYIEDFGIKGEPEVLVTDIKNGMCGWIDSLEYDKEAKTCVLEDYKTSVMDADKLKVYNHQMSWYGRILQNHGWTVNGLVVRDYDGDKWTEHQLEMLEVIL